MYLQETVALTCLACATSYCPSGASFGACLKRGESSVRLMLTEGRRIENSRKQVVYTLLSLVQMSEKCYLIPRIILKEFDLDYFAK